MDDTFWNRYAGLYYNPNEPNNLKIYQLRQLFLRAAAESVPGFMESLFKEVGRVLIGYKNNSSPKSSDKVSQFNGQVDDAIRAWARSFNIESDWVLDEAFGILILASKYSSRGIDLLKAFGGWRRDTSPGRATHMFELPAWNPKEERDTQYKERADRAWAKSRDEYIAATKRQVAESRLAQIPARRNRRIDKKLHFHWAALHQCVGKSIEELADQYHEDTEAIRISVGRILNDLGFSSPT